MFINVRYKELKFNLQFIIINLLNNINDKTQIE